MFLSIKGLIMFCKFLTNTYHFTYDNVKPCCWIKHTPQTQVNILDIDKIKETFSNLNKVDDWLPECSYCYDLEKAGTDSPRTISNTNTSVYTNNDPIGDPIKIELQLDDDCNAACLMCGTWNSTTWQQYETKTLKLKSPTYRWNTTVEDRINTVTEIIDFSKVKQIHFFGGEPFKTSTQLRMLKLVKNPKDVNLVYVTNGSLFPCEETLELWKKFGDVNVAVSIDAIGEQFNYLRWPLQWHQVEANLEKYFLLKHSNLVINLSFTATPFNMFYIDTYTEWAKKFAIGKHNTTKIEKWFLNPHPVVGLEMNMNSIPPALQEVIKQKYGEDSRIAKIMSPFDVQKCQYMLNYINYHDRHRKSNWKEVFPEIVDYFDMDKLSPVPKYKVWEIKSI